MAVMSNFGILQRDLWATILVGCFSGLLLFTGCDATTESEQVDHQAVRSETRLDSIGDDSTQPSHGPGQTASSSAMKTQLLNDAHQLSVNGNPAEAVKILTELLLKDESDVEVIFHLANATAATGKLSDAVLILDNVPQEHPQAGLPALGQSAAWCVELERYSEAEKRYRTLLSFVPDAAPALRQLAHLLNRQGRRHEAADLIRRLCLQGNVRQDELHALMSLSNAMHDEIPQDPGLPRNDRGYWPIGNSGVARKKFEEQKYAEVVELLRPVVTDATVQPAVFSFFGRAAAEAQDQHSFRWWLNRTTPELEQFSEYWAALGTDLVMQGRFEEAIRALAEAVSRDPTDMRSLSRLRQSLLALGDFDSAQQFADRWTQVRDCLNDNNAVASENPPNPDALEKLIDRLQALGRPLEAILWQAIQQHYRQASPAEKNRLNAARQNLVSNGTAFPERINNVCGLNYRDYPLPKMERTSVPEIATGENTSRSSGINGAFRNVAPEIQLKHSFSVASQPQRYGYAIHQMLGGGVAVLDVNKDGQPDLFFAQGKCDAPDFKNGHSNQLFLQSESFCVDTTFAAGLRSSGYTMAVSAGDWNQDGFSDLVVRSVLSDDLYLNQGDGTFRRVQIANNRSSNHVPASVAIADVTGDQLPDMFLANYIDDPRRYLTPPTDESGRPLQPILPSKFNPAKNMLAQGDGNGGFDLIEFSQDQREAATSLGVVITDFDGVAGNEIFVGNDMKPNQLWKFGETSGWQDIAAIKGCAFSFTGASTASMGIAAGDLTNNGALDLHITNYQNECASLFLSNQEMFTDRHLGFKIAEESARVLGFGSQTIDYDNDGFRDLVVTNGHIDDAIENTGGFKQPAQLFINAGNEFRLGSITDASGYWESGHLGRALATLDYDSNGLLDFVVTHIEEPTALLLNKTETGNHWMQLQLTGTDSERDAIGARIDITIGNQKYTDWVKAGDGYFCSNEKIACFGLGPATRIDSIEITWPTGSRQVFENVDVDQRLLVVEGATDVFTLQPNSG